ncbi:MAG TPA: hypothetical protein VF174_02145 [Micromonosporaceae bacterium]
MLLGAVLVSLRLLPGSPFAARAATRWGEPPAHTSAGRAGDPTPSPSPTLPPLPVRPAEVRLDAEGWWSWAILDTRTGEISGAPNMTETSTTASMIKAWIAADYLRRTAEAGQTPSNTRLRQLTAIIRDSNNEYTSSLFREVGRTESIERLIEICELTDSHPANDGGWSRTALSAQDTARLGACIADGRAAGPEWTDWLLEEMRLVRGVGDFGIRKAFPAEEQKTIAIKNGWIERTQEREYHVNCLAIGDGWTMGVLVRYPFGLGGYEYGMNNCQKIAEQLLAPTPTPEALSSGV